METTSKIINWLIDIAFVALIATPVALVAMGRIGELILFGIAFFGLWFLWTLARFLTYRPD